MREDAAYRITSTPANSGSFRFALSVIYLVRGNPQWVEIDAIHVKPGDQVTVSSDGRLRLSPPVFA